MFDYSNHYDHLMEAAQEMGQVNFTVHMHAWVRHWRTLYGCNMYICLVHASAGHACVLQAGDQMNFSRKVSAAMTVLSFVKCHATCVHTRWSSRLHVQLPPSRAQGEATVCTRV